ncbi:hypothetical protein M408DRAFT_8135 [Serendipita vermifera MAFF 305830]|uniref:Uncharacterized protein n=1 Tax=Serendipita vermifera MAFF 305830 TaxID=933852 RepID=A0A0C2XK65_SERVB|nr:hypothetical protein M408DRAFT_8135 [Serendipita vermifera MAFF 305830]
MDGVFAVHAAGLAMLFAYLAQRSIPSTPLARVIAEMVVAFVSLTALSLFIIAHHRKGTHGRIMNQTQEEVVLILLFGLFWFGTKAWNDSRVLGKVEDSSSEPAWVPSPALNLRGCPGGHFMCVMEEMSW